jgi:hypothetical protein
VGIKRHEKKPFSLKKELLKFGTNSGFKVLNLKTHKMDELNLKQVKWIIGAAYAALIGATIAMYYLL